MNRLFSALILAISIESTPAVEPLQPGELLISDYPGYVARFNGTTGELMDHFVESGAGGLTVPSGMITAPDGSLLISDFQSHRVLQFSSSGEYLRDLVSVGSDGLTYPGDLHTRGADLLVVSRSSNEIYRYDWSSGAFRSVLVESGAGGLHNIDAVVVTPAGDLLVLDYLSYGILRFDGDTGDFLGTFAFLGYLAELHGMTLGPDGNLYVIEGDLWSRKIWRIDGTTGNYTDTFAGDSLFGPSLSGARHLAFGPDGDLYVNSHSGMQRFDGAGGAYLGSFSTGLEAPTAFTFVIPEPSAALLMCIAGMLTVVRRVRR